MKCLVVDDSSITRRILAGHLRRLGCTEVIEAADGEQAIARCTPDVDLVLTDWNMPGLSVAEVVRGLRRLRRRTALSILLVSSRTARDDVAEALDVGVDGWLIKPVTEDALRAGIPQALLPAAGTGTDG